MTTYMGRGVMNGKFVQGRGDSVHKDYGPLLERSGFTNVAFSSDYALTAIKSVPSALCVKTCSRNKYYVPGENGDVCVKNFSKKCVERVVGTESLPPFAFKQRFAARIRGCMTINLGWLKL